MKFANRQERVFVNRYGEHIYEDILHFVSTKKGNYSISRARNIAYYLLNSVITYAPEESQDDLKDAIEKINDIQPSPLFEVKELVRS